MSLPVVSCQARRSERDLPKTGRLRAAAALLRLDRGRLCLLKSMISPQLRGRALSQARLKRHVLNNRRFSDRVEQTSTEAEQRARQRNIYKAQSTWTVRQSTPRPSAESREQEQGHIPTKHRLGELIVAFSFCHAQSSVRRFQGSAVRRVTNTSSQHRFPFSRWRPAPRKHGLQLLGRSARSRCAHY